MDEEASRVRRIGSIKDLTWTSAHSSGQSGVVTLHMIFISGESGPGEIWGTSGNGVPDRHRDHALPNTQQSWANNQIWSVLHAWLMQPQQCIIYARNNTDTSVDMKEVT